MIDHADGASLGPSRSGLVVHLLVALSGATALVFEVLWMRELGLVLGNTAHAAATTLAAWFLGMAIGAWWWGPIGDRGDRPLRTYAQLELGIAGTAVVGWLLLSGARSLSPGFLDASAHPAIRGLMALALVLPTTILMGGTIPVLVRDRVLRGAPLGSSGSRLLAFNTIGAALGAFAAGFYLPIAIGIRSTWFAAVSVNIVIAIIAYGYPPIAKTAAGPHPSPDGRSSADTKGTTSRTWGHALVLAAASGAMILALEVVWTRVLAQVLQNSVYAFSAVLVVILVTLALGAVIANRLGRLREPWRALPWLLIGSGILVRTTGPWLAATTDGLNYIGGDHGFEAYVFDVFRHTALLVAAPCLVAGIVFPFVFHLVKQVGAPARTLGRITSVNLIGGVAGSLLSGFWLLPALGMWNSLRLIGLIYVALGLGYATIGVRARGLESGRRSRAAITVGACCLGLSVMTFSDETDPLIRLAEGERLVEARTGTHGVAAVTAFGDNLTLRLDNSYQLGSVSGQRTERRLTHIPLVAHGNPKSVFFIGLATGITAGAALSHSSIERVVVAELVPDVHTLARRHFAGHANGLFEDDRVSIVNTDGRHLLERSESRFDVIQCDLVLPWHARAGYLYTREFYTLVRSRLDDGGVFAQWFSMREWTAETFAIAARTMADVFPDVTVWRARKDPISPVIGLIARSTPAPLTARSLDIPPVIARDFPDFGGCADDQSFLMTYAGPLPAYFASLPTVPLNTDDMPVLEYRAPIAIRAIHARTENYLAYGPLERLFASAAQAVPPDRDSSLLQLSPRQRNAVRAGLTRFRHEVHQRAGHQETAAQAYLDTLVHLGLEPL